MKMFNAIHREESLNFHPKIIALKRIFPLESELIQEETAGHDETKTKKKRTVICSRCGTIITCPENSIEVIGSHSHVCTNPAGAVYRIGCFAEAPGCDIFGEPTSEFTWFDGYTWRFALCSGCHAHLGWFYESDAGSFFGLILGNLTENY